MNNLSLMQGSQIICKCLLIVIYLYKHITLNDMLMQFDTVVSFSTILQKNIKIQVAY